MGDFATMLAIGFAGMESFRRPWDVKTTHSTISRSERKKRTADRKQRRKHRKRK